MLSAPKGLKCWGLRSVISELIFRGHELILLVANLLCPLSLVFETIILFMSTDTVLKLTLFSCNCSDILLVHLTPNRMVRVRALAGVIVLCS